MSEKPPSYQPQAAEGQALPPGVAASPQFLHVDVAAHGAGQGETNGAVEGLMEGRSQPSSSAAGAAEMGQNSQPQPIPAAGVPVAVAPYAAIPPSYFGMQAYNPAMNNGAPYYANNAALPPGYVSTAGVYGQGVQSIPVAVPLNVPMGGGYGGGVIIPPGAAVYQPAMNGGRPLQPMNVVGPTPMPGQPGHLPITGRWRDSWLDCFNACGICCLSWIFPPLRWAWTVERSHFATFRYGFFVYFLPWAIFVALYIASPYTGRSASGWLSLLALFFYIFLVSIGTRYRSRLRAKYQIAGSDCEDCLLHTCCKPCAIAQEARHVDADLGLPL